MHSNTRFRLVLLASAAAFSTADAYSGFGTVYGPIEPSGGNCNLQSYPKEAVTNYAALNQVQWDSTMNCGRCAKVWCTDPQCENPSSSSEIVYIIDQCPGCEEGDLDLSPSVFKAITGMEYTKLQIEWDYVTCPSTGSNRIQYCLKEGSSGHWAAIQPTHMSAGVDSVVINDRPTTMVASSYYFLLTTETDQLPLPDISNLKITMTSIAGEVIEDVVSFANAKCVEVDSQFTASGSIQTEPDDAKDAPTIAPVTKTPETESPPTPTPIAPIQQFSQSASSSSDVASPHSSSADQEIDLQTESTTAAPASPARNYATTDAPASSFPTSAAPTETLAAAELSSSKSSSNVAQAGVESPDAPASTVRGSAASTESSSSVAQASVAAIGVPMSTLAAGASPTEIPTEGSTSASLTDVEAAAPSATDAPTNVATTAPSVAPADAATNAAASSASRLVSSDNPVVGEPTETISTRGSSGSGPTIIISVLAVLGCLFVIVAFVMYIVIKKKQQLNELLEQEKTFDVPRYSCESDFQTNIPMDEHLAFPYAAAATPQPVSSSSI